MSTQTPINRALINPNQIRWARIRSKLTPQQIANKVGVSEEKFSSWETGVDRPTFRQAQILADRLYVPIGCLYLSEPPHEAIPIPDLRTTKGTDFDRPSPNFLDLLYDVLRKQAWYRQELLEQGASNLEFVGRFDIDINPNEVASDIRHTLGLTNTLWEYTKTWDAYLSALVPRAEDIGIIVLRTGVVQGNTSRPLSINEFRGFAISDSIAPIIFINGRDAKAAQIFTFAHEVAHLWFGASGITNLDFRQKSSGQAMPVERVTDMVAAEVLMPQSAFPNRWHSQTSAELRVSALARYFRVSTVAVLRRALDLNLIDQQTFSSLYDIEVEKQTVPTQRGGDYYNNAVNRNSFTLTKRLLSAAAEGRISYRDAANLLSVPIQNLGEVATRVIGGPLP